MRTALALIAFVAAAAELLAVQTGDTRETGIREFGQPASIIQAGTGEVLVYPQGRVILKQGLVSEISVLVRT